MQKRKLSGPRKGKFSNAYRVKRVKAPRKGVSFLALQHSGSGDIRKASFSFVHYISGKTGIHAAVFRCRQTGELVSSRFKIA